MVISWLKMIFSDEFGWMMHKINDQGLTREDYSLFTRYLGELHNIVRGQERKINTQETALTTDGLTKLPNTRAFNERLEEEISWHERYKEPLTYIITDVFGLKNANDMHGHETGDQLLRDAAYFLKDNKRAFDFLSRRGEGSDEFLMLCRDTELEEARELTSRLKRVLDDQYIEIKGKGFPLLIAFGCAQYEGNLEQMFQKASIDLGLERIYMNTFYPEVKSKHR